MIGERAPVRVPIEPTVTSAPDCTPPPEIAALHWTSASAVQRSDLLSPGFAPSGLPALHGFCSAACGGVVAKPSGEFRRDSMAYWGAGEEI